MSFLKKNPLLKLGLLALILVGLPVAVFLSQRQADDRSRASKTVKLSFAPTSSSSAPINVAPGGTVSVDLILTPGTSQVSFLKAQLTYDASKFRVESGGFAVNTQAFPVTIQGPVYASGTVSFAVSVGADGTKVIQTPTKAGTLTLRAIGSGPSQVGFAAGAQALSIDPNSTPTENVVSSTIPAHLTISGNATTGPTQPPTSCSNAPSSTMLIIDKSGSMSVAADVNKITQAKTAAKSYIDIIAQDTRNKIGLVSYGNTASLDSPLTDNYASVKSRIDTLTAIGSTCTECAIKKANEALASGSPTQKKIAILLTDGKANFVEGTPNQVDVSLAEQRALAAAAAGRAAGIVYYTIGLGQEINAPFLQQIANSTGGKYFASPTGSDLTNIYNQISQISGKGSVTGFVFNDANNNRALDTSEQKLSGWTLELYSGGVKTPHIVVSDPNGFNITGICDGTYNLKEVLQNGWRQTLPTDPNGYSIIINNGNAITDKNFGNFRGNTCADGIDNNGNNFIDIQDPICHTDGNRNNPNSYDPNLPERNGNTCADGLDNNNNNLIDGLDPICHDGGNINNPYNPDLPEGGTTGTRLNLTVFLHGIGNSGDNATELNSLSNKNPLRTTRNATVMIYNISNQLVASASGQINYSQANGNYTGIVTTANPLPQGSYAIRVFTPEHLVRFVSGIQTLNPTQANNMPPISVVAGDVNDDNKLNILDYNTILDCYSDRSPAPSCTDPNKKIITDLNDDGSVQGTDYNLFLRELSTQPGE